MDLNPYQLRTLRHMLGIDKPEDDRPKPYRNYYCANPGEAEMKELERLGAIELYDTRGDYEWWRCTEAGRAAAIASHKTIRYSAAKRRYIRFLDLRDCCPDLTFHQFLTDPRYRQSSTSTEDQP
jgi:hypothetical protein